MVPAIRKSFNKSFTTEKYQSFLDEIHNDFPGALDFRIAETPVFINKQLGDEMIETCEYIIDKILGADFIKLTENAIPTDDRVANENAHPHFMAFDFGICLNDDGNYMPALIEIQGFPTLFAFQAYYPEILQKHFTIPQQFSNYFNGFDKNTYIQELKELILGDAKPEEVILLEIKPNHQKTRIDFYCTQSYFGIQPICITELMEENNALFYMLNGQKQHIKRIYNRIIFDELHAMKEELGTCVDIRKKFDVEWITHPNWFYRISKFTLPFLEHRSIPKTRFLSEIQQLPENLHEYVLKPLFSFAGQGVIIDLKKEDLLDIKDPQNWILQKKVSYAECIETPDNPAKVEIRLMYTWKDGDKRPILLTNLARLSKGKMIGTRYNKDKDWVGGSVAFFEQ